VKQGTSLSLSVHTHTDPPGGWHVSFFFYSFVYMHDTKKAPRLPPNKPYNSPMHSASQLLVSYLASYSMLGSPRIVGFVWRFRIKCYKWQQETRATDCDYELRNICKKKLLMSGRSNEQAALMRSSLSGKQKITEYCSSSYSKNLRVKLHT
jgi:hypothetical protein